MGREVPIDPLFFSVRWRVRSYELDQNGHVNNAVYLNWAEEIATEHAEAAGYGRDWAAARGGGWLIRRSEVTHHRPALYGDEVEVSVRVESVHGVRAVRRTWIRRAMGSCWPRSGRSGSGCGRPTAGPRACRRSWSRWRPAGSRRFDGSPSLVDSP